MEVIALAEDRFWLHAGVAGKEKLIAVIELKEPVKDMTDEELGHLVASVADEVRRDLQMHGTRGGEG